ncbi:MAG: type II secretion system protein N [Candidatus Theseobacter exili]|nr:type II secretion system protein N [Candidatus Theseobacter exili]
MRKVYLILNTIFIIAIVMLLNTYANSIEASEKSSNTKEKIRKQIKKIRKKRRAKVVVRDENLVAVLNNSNLFEVNRGEEIVAETKSAATKNNSSFKLMGVCHYGELKGAIISSNSRSKTSSGKSYFTIGEDVGDGYKLYEIAAKTVILKNGSRKITLELVKAESKPQRRPTARTRRPRVTPRRSTRNNKTRR